MVNKIVLDAFSDELEQIKQAAGFGSIMNPSAYRAASRLTYGGRKAAPVAQKATAALKKKKPSMPPLSVITGRGVPAPPASIMRQAA